MGYIKAYHGTNKHFKRFKGDFFFFTPDSDYANTYCKKASFSKDIQKEYQDSACIIPVHLEMNNTLIIDALGKNFKYIVLGEKMGTRIYKELLSKTDISYLTLDELIRANNTTNDIAFLGKELGYDSVIIKNVEDLGAEKEGKQTTDVFIVFNTKQISSSITNKKFEGIRMKYLLSFKNRNLESNCYKF